MSDAFELEEGPHLRIPEHFECTVIGCFKSKSKPPFHPFPKKSTKTLEEWFIRIKRTVYSQDGRVCSRHFTDNDFLVKDGVKTKILKNTAKPSLYLKPQDDDDPNEGIGRRTRTPREQQKAYNKIALGLSTNYRKLANMIQTRQASGTRVTVREEFKRRTSNPYAVCKVKESKTAKISKKILSKIDESAMEKALIDSAEAQNNVKYFFVFNGGSNFNLREEELEGKLAVFHCPRCEFKSVKESKVRSHFSMTHITLRCRTCGEIFQKHQDLRQHNITMHNPKTKNTLAKSDDFKNDDFIEVDLGLNTEEKVKSELEDHYSNEDQHFTCQLCHQNFEVLKELHEHMKFHPEMRNNLTQFDQRLPLPDFLHESNIKNSDINERLSLPQIKNESNFEMNLDIHEDSKLHSTIDTSLNVHSSETITDFPIKTEETDLDDLSVASTSYHQPNSIFDSQNTSIKDFEHVIQNSGVNSTDVIFTNGPNSMEEVQNSADIQIKEESIDPFYDVVLPD